MEKRKLFFFTKENRGGTVKFLLTLNSRLSKDFITEFYFYKKNNYGFFPKNAKFISSKYPASLEISIIKFFYSFFNILKTIRLLFFEKEKSLLVACDFYTFIILSIVKTILRKKNTFVYILDNNIVALLEGDSDFVFRGIKSSLLSLLIEKADKYVLLTEKMSLIVSKKYNLSKGKMIVMPYGTDGPETKSLTSKKNLKDDKKLFKNHDIKLITVMNLVEQKDFTTLIAAFMTLCRKYGNIKLFIVGEGYLKKKIKSIIIKNNLRNKIILIGNKKNIYPYLKKADIFIFSSFIEGFAFSIIEAMTIGLPIVSSNTDFGPSEILKNGEYGMLFPVGNYKKMAEKIEILLCDKKLLHKYSSLSKKRAKEFNFERTSRRYVNFFKNL